MTIGGYGGNSLTGASSKGHSLGSYFRTMDEIKSFRLTGFFHTHPGSGNFSVSDRIVPSNKDLDSRDKALEKNPNLKFFILIHPLNYGDEFPLKIPYTTGYSRR